MMCQYSPLFPPFIFAIILYRIVSFLHHNQVHHLIGNTLIILGNLYTSNDPSTTSSKPRQFSLKNCKHYYYTLISLKDDTIKYYDYKRQNNKFNVQNILSPHFSPKIGDGFLWVSVENIIHFLFIPPSFPSHLTMKNSHLSSLSFSTQPNSK